MLATPVCKRPRCAQTRSGAFARLFAVDSRVCATPRGEGTIDLWDIGTRTRLTTVTSPAFAGTDGIPAIGPDASEVLALAPFAKGGTSRLYLWTIP